MLKDLNSANSNIINNGIDEEIKRLLEEFRNPNMILGNIKSTLQKHESTINQIKANIKDFKLKVDQTNFFLLYTKFK